MKRIISLLMSMLLILSVFGFQAFAVESTMSVSGATYPTYLDKGMSFSIAGKITSNSNITSVTVGIYKKSTGAVVKSKTHAPNATTYNLSLIDPDITFGSLAEDNYIYKITASDKNITNKVLLSKDFVVGFPNGAVGDQMANVDWKVIDISQWQPNVNWSLVKNEANAVILRIGYRTSGSLSIYEDSSFKTHYENAVRHGIPVGVYFYSVALSETAMKEEAKFVIDTIKKYNCKLEMPVYIDMEHDSQLALGRTMCTKLANVFCEEMIKNNYFPGIYCNLSWAQTGLVMSSLAEYTIWLAQYSSRPTYTGKFEMWQYSNTSTISGISEKVDMNKCYKNIPAFIRSKGYNGIGSGSGGGTGSTEYADYSKLDQLISMASGNMSIYTAESKSAVETALSQARALSRQLPKAEQSKVNTAATNLENALCRLVVSGGFEANANSGVRFDDANQKVTGIPQNTTKADLLNNYITLKGTAEIEYTGLSNDKIIKGTVLYIKINSTTIAKYTVA